MRHLCIAFHREELRSLRARRSPVVENWNIQGIREKVEEPGPATTGFGKSQSNYLPTNLKIPFIVEHDALVKRPVKALCDNHSVLTLVKLIAHSYNSCFTGYRAHLTSCTLICTMSLNFMRTRPTHARYHDENHATPMKALGKLSLVIFHSGFMIVNGEEVKAEGIFLTYPGSGILEVHALKKGQPFWVCAFHDSSIPAELFATRSDVQKGVSYSRGRELMSWITVDTE
ncbi:hypothetical protein CPB84DRAFT_1469367 [Gymnopilus junonius]|uniref:Uncharacterized protein n=1 Tax=Gymnopilus junonius TaxID=109634 RepID=A0A9P5TJH1_GYMJU|nr:hypothetical protein CPB84DRAFT_1469367 [Gymnopilus junonius]